MARRLRRALKGALLRSRLPLKGRLARLYLRTVERWRSLGAARGPAVDADGLAVPPPRLRVLVAGSADLDRFLDSGRLQADYLREIARDAGRPLEQMDEILDFGCGCGRIARWYAALSGPQIHGCDYNAELIDWCQGHLDFMSAARTELAPPLPYPDGAFDFVYAFSVFTHLSVDLAGRWIAEMARVVRTGGLMWFTTHGASYRERLLAEERARFDAGEIVVSLPEIEGTNLCASYWPPAALGAMLDGRFEVLRHFDPGAEPERAERLFLAHDAYLARRL